MQALIPKVKLDYEGFQTPIRGGEADPTVEGGYNVVGLTSSSVAAEGLSTWDNGTAYTSGDQVSWKYRKWTAKVNSTGQEPSEDTSVGVTNWTFDGWLNRYSMFSGILGSSTVSPDIDVSFSAESVDALALFGIQATHLIVTITDPTAGVVYSRSEDVNSELPDANFYSWFYEYQTAEYTGVIKKDLVLDDLIGSQYPNATVRVQLTIEGGGLSYTDDVKLEFLSFGPLFSLGTALFGSSHGFKDFSIVSEDGFGGTSKIVPRKRNKKATYQIVEKTDRLSDIQNFLAANSTNPLVYIGYDRYLGTLVYAFASDFEPVLRDTNTTQYSIKVKGL